MTNTLKSVGNTPKTKPQSSASERKSTAKSTAKNIKKNSTNTSASGAKITLIMSGQTKKSTTISGRLPFESDTLMTQNIVSEFYHRPQSVARMKAKKSRLRKERILTITDGKE